MPIALHDDSVNDGEQPKHYHEHVERRSRSRPLQTDKQIVVSNKNEIDSMLSTYSSYRFIIFSNSYTYLFRTVRLMFWLISEFISAWGINALHFV